MAAAKRTQILNSALQASTAGGFDGLVLYRIIRFQPLADETLRQVCLDWIGRWRA